MTDVFKRAGWLLMTVPQANVKPLELLVKDGKFIRRLNSSIETLLIPTTVPLPDVGGDKSLPQELHEKVEMNLNAEVNVSWLKSIFNLANPSLEVKSALEKSEVLLYDFHKASVNDVDTIMLDKYLNTAKEDTDAKSTVKELHNDNIYVVTSVIKCREFTVGSIKASEVSASADVSVPQVTNVSMEVGKKSANELVIKSDGETWLTIAIKAVRLFYVTGGWFTSKPPMFRLESADEELVRSNDMPGMFEYLQDDIDNSSDSADSNGNNNNNDCITTVELK